MTPGYAQTYMQLAIEQARRAAARDEVPVGAVLVDMDSAEIIAQAHNRILLDCDPTAHAELLVLREGAKRLGTPRLTACDLYVTLEPCAMCAHALAHARIRRLYFGAYDPKGGGVEHGPCIFFQPTTHHRPEVIGGLREAECAALLQDYFQTKRG